MNLNQHQIWLEWRDAHYRELSSESSFRQVGSHKSPYTTKTGIPYASCLLCSLSACKLSKSLHPVDANAWIIYLTTEIQIGWYLERFVIWGCQQGLSISREVYAAHSCCVGLEHCALPFAAEDYQIETKLFTYTENGLDFLACVLITWSFTNGDHTQ